MHLDFSDIIAAISLAWTAIIANDGDGDAFDVRVFGHNCIIRAYAWEKLSNGNWKIGERTMVPRISNEDGDDVK